LSFLYDDARFRTLGQPHIKLPDSALRALSRAHQKLIEQPDSRTVDCLCGAASDVRVTIADRHGLPLSLVLCRGCGVIRANPQPSSDVLSWFYAEVYRDLYGPFASDDTKLFDSKRWKSQLVVRALEQAGLSVPDGPVVDLGCGGGWTLAAFKGAGRVCIGYDFDPRLIGIGRARGLDLRIGGAEVARQQAVRAGLLIFSHVLEHLPDPQQGLRELRSLLTHSSLLYIEVPHVRRIGNVALANDSLRYWQRAHLWDLQQSHLRALTERAGYEVLWASEDEESVFLLCRVCDTAGTPAWPLIGPQVGAQLLRFESRHQSRPYRLAGMARNAYRKRSRQVRGFFR
jgi:SAM-dependent methyltransferase